MFATFQRGRLSVRPLGSLTVLQNPTPKSNLSVARPAVSNITKRRTKEYEQKTFNARTMKRNNIDTPTTSSTKQALLLLGLARISQDRIESLAGIHAVGATFPLADRVTVGIHARGHGKRFQTNTDE